MQRVLTREGELAAKLRTKQATIGVVGLGYVGLPLVIRMIETGYDVVGFDIDQRKVDLLKVGKGYINHIPESDILDVVMSGRFLATTDFAHIARVDAILLCVPTPLGEHREPDLSYIVSTVESILPHIHEGQLISLESTTYPGTTREEICRRLEDNGHRIGEDVHVVYSPEREDPANPNFNTQTIPKVVGGATPACLEAGCALYGNIVDRVVPVSSLEVAEMTKLLENIYRAVNIGLVNELKIVADRMGVDIWEVIEAAKTKPFGFTAFYPGPGLGGHCIPIDPFYLTWKAHEYGVHTRFIELAGEVNTGMPKWVVGKVQDALNEEGKALRGAKILVLGIAYKKNLDDMRESPSVELMELLSEKGAEVSYSDPYLPRFPRMRRHHFDLVSQDITAESLATFDCVLLATDHDDFDYELIQEHAQLVIDTRGRFNRQLPQVIAA